MKFNIVIFSCIFQYMASPVFADTVPAKVEETNTEVKGRTRIGLGVFWSQSAFSDRIRPDGGIFRIRLASGISIEPSLSYLQYRSTIADEFTTEHQFSFSTLLRTPIGKRRGIELSALTGVSVGASNYEFENSGSSNTRNSVVVGGMSWGIGLERFISDDYSLAISATSEIFGIQRGFGDTIIAIGPFGSLDYKLSAMMYF